MISGWIAWVAPLAVFSVMLSLGLVLTVGQIVATLRRPLVVLAGRFAAERMKLVTAVRALTPADLERSARHPRLGTPMRVIDLAYFVAEHDDHHMARLRELVTDGPDQE